MIIQQNRSYSSYSMAVTCNFTAGTAYVLIFGAELALLELFDCVEGLSPLPFDPFIIPTLALELQARRQNETIENCSSQIYDIESRTGMRQFNHDFEHSISQPDDWKSSDFLDITRNLSGFLSRFAFLESQAESGVYLADLMQRYGNGMKIERQKTGDNKKDDASLIDTLSMLEEIKSLYSGTKLRCRYLSGRTQAQVHTVLDVHQSKASQR